MLQVRLRRYRCPDCCSVWRQATSTTAAPRAGLAVALNAANDAFLATGQQLLINDSPALTGPASSA